MNTKSKHAVKTFERAAGPMPSLKRAGPATAATPAAAGANSDADQPPEAAVPSFLSQKEVLLRLVETLKAL